MKMEQKMKNLRIGKIFIGIVLIVGMIALVHGAVQPPPDGMPPMGEPPGDFPPENMGQPGPGGSASQSSYLLAGEYTVDGENASSENKVFTSNETDMSAIYVTNGGSLNLKNPTIVTSGNTSSGESSSFYGLNGAVLVNNGSTVSISGGSISTTGSGANDVIPTGEGTSVTLSDMTITATGDGGHGVMATLGASLQLTNVTIDTTGPHGAPVATDRGSGTVTVSGGKVTSSGADSPGIYSTGVITVSDAEISSVGTEAAVIEGFNSILLNNTDLTGGVQKTGGVMIYQSFSGDAEVGTGTFTMTGGSLTVPEGPVFFITNTDAEIYLNNADITSASGILINATATSRWGTEGKNGGNVSLIAENQKLSGSLIADETSTMYLSLTKNSSLTGTIRSGGISLDETSSWNVTGDSYLTFLMIPDGKSDDVISHIIGNVFTVTYDATLPENSLLGGKTYNLKNGGTLVPE
jgi:hypothetical protein